MNTRKCVIFLFLLLSCLPDENRTCDFCDSFFTESSYFSYPIRKVEKQKSKFKNTLNSNEIQNDSFYHRRLLTSWEIAEVEERMFCFIGKSEQEVLDYFNYFWIDPYVINSKDSLSTIITVLVNINEVKNKSQEIYRFKDTNSSKNIQLKFTNHGGVNIYSGTKQDSINHFKCIENTKQK